MPDYLLPRRRGQAGRPTRAQPRAPTSAARARPRTDAPCACGGGCPRCKVANTTTAAVRAPLEQDADHAAARVLSAPADGSAHDPPARPKPTARAPGVGGGEPLPAATLRRFEPRFGVGLDHVRVHRDGTATELARAQRADAYTHGADIVFGKDRYAPGTAGGDQLLAHELAHVVQQTAHAAGAPGGPAASAPVTARAMAPGPARSVDDWLRGSVDVRSYSYTQLVSEVDELNQWIDRQTATTDDVQIIAQAMEYLRAEIARRDRAATAPPRPARERRRGRRGRAAADAAADTPAADAAPDRYPRVLIEMTSVHYENPAEMREEYDLIMRWLVQPDVSAEQRRILESERENLAPQFHTERERAVTERHAERVRAALTPSDPTAENAVVDLARTITGISGEPGNPNVFYIYDHGERVAISREQAEGLRDGLFREFSNAGRGIESRASYYWDRYHAQVEINEEHYIISGVIDLFGDIDDPRAALTSRYMRLQARLDVMREHLSNERMVEFARLLPAAEALGQEIRVLARAFYEGYIEGAETAIRVLEFTRNAAFALTGAIAAVVAAPFVAGVVAGTGATGLLATGLTMVGTGTVVGGGMATVRGTSTALGTGFAGGSWEEVAEAGLAEAETGAREGFIAGAGGAAGRGLGLATGGMGAGAAMAVRVGGEMIINGMAAAADVLMRHDAAERTSDAVLHEAAMAGAIAALSAIPGALLGGSSNPLVRRWVAPFVAGCTTYVGMRAGGADHAEALSQAAVAIASAAALGRAGGGDEFDASMEARGRAVGTELRDASVSGMRTVRSTIAATMIGTTDALPSLRSGFGGTPMTIESVDLPRTAPVGVIHEEAAALGVIDHPASRATTATEELAPAVPHVEEAAPSAPHVEEAAPSAPRGAEEAPVAPRVGEDEVAVAPAPASEAAAPSSPVVDADDAALDAAFAGHADVSEPSAMGRNEGRSESRTSLEAVTLTPAQRAAATELHGQRLGSDLSDAWSATTNPRETADRATIRGHVEAGRMEEARVLAREAFDRHRSRFWRRVRRTPGLRRLFTDAGMEFAGGSGAPVYRDPATGEILDRMTLEHSTRLADDPLSALSGSNLQTVLGDENSVMLEFIRRADVFQRH